MKKHRQPERMNVYEMVEHARGNKTIVDAIGMAYAVLNQYERPMCSVSGGSDSDVILDMIWRLDAEMKVRYVFFNTGLEYQATKEHLSDLEQKYDIKIERISPIKSVFQCCREYGQPFLSKQVSTYMAMLQRCNFTWEDMPIDALLRRYPKITSAVKWWCNSYDVHQYRIDAFSHLKTFLIDNPPTFPISAACCTWAKKKPAQKAYKEGGHDLDIVGIRKAEGGVRSNPKTNCLTQGAPRNIFRPIFKLTNADKAEYNRLFGVKNSDCYSVYGLRRTGCVGCPFNRKLFFELDVMRRHEPGLYKAACNVFGESYAYTMRYREFVKNFGDPTLNLFQQG